MTEDEAKTKWCAHSRVANGNAGGCNRGFKWMMKFFGDVDEFTEANCIGSQCMAWRWVERHYIDEMPPKSPKRGFCGLAGKP